VQIEAATFRRAIDRNETRTALSEFGDRTTSTKRDGDGKWYLHVQPKDTAGNEGVLATVSAILDNTDPTVSIQRSPEQDTHHGGGFQAYSAEIFSWFLENPRYLA